MSEEEIEGLITTLRDVASSVRARDITIRREVEYRVRSAMVDLGAAISERNTQDIANAILRDFERGEC